MDVDLLAVAEPDRIVLANLMQFYLYDFSEFHGQDLTPRGYFPHPDLDGYFSGPSHEPWFIKVGDRLAGFALARIGADGAWTVAEFFIVRKHRRKGVARAAARLLFARHPGPWTLSFHHENAAAAAFWPSVVREVCENPVSEAERLSADVELPATRLRFDVPAT